MINEIKTNINRLLGLLSFHKSIIEKIPPIVIKTIPNSLILLTDNKLPNCIKNTPITKKPIVEIDRNELKSLITDFLSSLSIFK